MLRFDLVRAIEDDVIIVYPWVAILPELANFFYHSKSRGISILTDNRLNSGDLTFRQKSQLEKVTKQQNKIMSIGRLISDFDDISCFQGVIFFSREIMGLIGDSVDYINQEANFKINDSMNEKSFRFADFIHFLQKRHAPVDVIPNKGWATSLRHESDRINFHLGSKAQTLNRLSRIMGNKYFLDSFSFTVVAWNANSQIILDQIQTQFAKTNVIDFFVCL